MLPFAINPKYNYKIVNFTMFFLNTKPCKEFIIGIKNLLDTLFDVFYLLLCLLQSWLLNSLPSFVQSFFRRTKLKKLTYRYFGDDPSKKCSIHLVKGTASPCPACRMEKCVELNMSPDG